MHPFGFSGCHSINLVNHKLWEHYIGMEEVKNVLDVVWVLGAYRRVGYNLSMTYTFSFSEFEDARNANLPIEIKINEFWLMSIVHMNITLSFSLCACAQVSFLQSMHNVINPFHPHTNANVYILFEFLF